jgi:hypothetical protein
VLAALAALANAVHTLTGVLLRQVLLPGKLTVIPATPASPGSPRLTWPRSWSRSPPSPCSSTWPAGRAVEWFADVLRPIQSGDVNLYLFYVFAAVLVAYLLGAL